MMIMMMLFRFLIFEQDLKLAFVTDAIWQNGFKPIMKPQFNLFKLPFDFTKEYCKFLSAGEIKDHKNMRLQQVI